MKVTETQDSNHCYSESGRLCFKSISFQHYWFEECYCGCLDLPVWDAGVHSGSPAVRDVWTLSYPQPQTAGRQKPQQKGNLSFCLRNWTWKFHIRIGLTLSNGPRPITVSPGGRWMGSPPSAGTRWKPDIRRQVCKTGGSFDLKGHQPGKDEFSINVQQGSDSSSVLQNT